MTRPDNRISTVTDGEMQEFKKNLGICGFTADDIRMFNANIPQMKQWVEDGRGRLGNLWTTRELHLNSLTHTGYEISNGVRILLSNDSNIQQAEKHNALAIVIERQHFDRQPTTEQYDCYVGYDRWKQTGGDIMLRRSGTETILVRTKN